MSPFLTVQIEQGAQARQELSHQSSLSRRVDTFVFVSFCVLICFAPLAFGAVEVWSTFVVQSVTALLFLVTIFNYLANSQSDDFKNVALVPVLAFILLVFSQVAFNLSQYRHATWIEFLKLVAYAMAFCIALRCLRGSDRLRNFTFFIGIFGFCLSLFAILQHFTFNGKIYWLRTPTQGGAIFGPFVNRNHFAGLMEMLLPFALVGFLVPYMRREKRVMMLFASVLICASIFISLSRGGIVSFVAQVIFLASFLLFRSRNKRAAISVSLLGAALLPMLLWLGTRPILDRFSSMQDWMRLAIVKDSMHIIREFWISGTGLGTFPHIYPQYRTFTTDYFINQAHNDLAQLMVETGILGTVAVFSFLFLVYKRGLEKALSWNTSWKGAASLAALTGITGILVHSFFDFNLQITSNALIFCILCGVALARDRQSTLLIESSRRFRRSIPSLSGAAE